MFRRNFVKSKVTVVKVKGAYRLENPLQSYGASPATWDHTVFLPPNAGERVPP